MMEINSLKEKVSYLKEQNYITKKCPKMKFKNKVALIRRVKINIKRNKIVLRQKQLKVSLFQLKFNKCKKVKKMWKQMNLHMNKGKMNMLKIKKMEMRNQIKTYKIEMKLKTNKILR